MNVVYTYIVSCEIKVYSSFAIEGNNILLSTCKVFLVAIGHEFTFTTQIPPRFAYIYFLYKQNTDSRCINKNNNYAILNFRYNTD